MGDFLSHNLSKLPEEMLYVSGQNYTLLTKCQLIVAGSSYYRLRDPITTHTNGRAGFDNNLDPQGALAERFVASQ